MSDKHEDDRDIDEILASIDEMLSQKELYTYKPVEKPGLAPTIPSNSETDLSEPDSEAVSNKTYNKPSMEGFEAMLKEAAAPETQTESQVAKHNVTPIHVASAEEPESEPLSKSNNDSEPEHPGSAISEAKESLDETKHSVPTTITHTEFDGIDVDLEQLESEAEDSAPVRILLTEDDSIENDFGDLEDPAETIHPSNSEQTVETEEAPTQESGTGSDATEAEAETETDLDDYEDEDDDDEVTDHSVVMPRHRILLTEALLEPSSQEALPLWIEQESSAEEASGYFAATAEAQSAVVADVQQHATPQHETESEGGSTSSQEQLFEHTELVEAMVEHALHPEADQAATSMSEMAPIINKYELEQLVTKISEDIGVQLQQHIQDLLPQLVKTSLQKHFESEADSADS